MIRIVQQLVNLLWHPTIYAIIWTKASDWRAVVFCRKRRPWWRWKFPAIKATQELGLQLSCFLWALFASENRARVFWEKTGYTAGLRKKSDLFKFPVLGGVPRFDVVDGGKEEKSVQTSSDLYVNITVCFLRKALLDWDLVPIQHTFLVHSLPLKFLGETNGVFFLINFFRAFNYLISVL